MKSLPTILYLILSAQFSPSNLISHPREVHATVYNAVPEQTNEDYGNTAFMFELDLDDPYKHRIIAVSRDLLVEYPGGTKVEVSGTTYDGVYTVMDKMNKRYTNRIDILINIDMEIGNWPNATITLIKE